MASVVKKLAGQTVIYGISSILGRILNFVLTPIHTNYFSTAVYGIISYLYAYTAFINVVLTFGMETTFFRFLQDDDNPEKLYQQAFSWIFTLVLLFLGIVIMLKDQIAAGIGYPTEGHLIFMLGGILALDALAALPMAKLRYQERAKLFMIINLSNIFLTVLLNIIFIYVLEAGIMYVFIANLSASTLRTVLAFIVVPPRRLILSTSLLSPMLQYGGFIMLAGLAGTINEMLDRIMLKWLWTGERLWQGITYSGEELTGIYNANYKFAMLISLFTQAFKYAAEPFFFKSSKQEDSPESFSKIFHYYTLATLVGFLALSSFSKEIASIDITLGLGTTPKYVIGKDYWEGLVVVPILLLAYVFNGVYYNISIWFKITKQTRYALLFTSIGAVITVVVNFLGIPHMGYIASAYATLLSFLAMAIAVYITGRKKYPIPYRFKRLFVYLGFFILAYIINSRIILIFEPVILHILLKTIVCMAVLALVVFIEKRAPVFTTNHS